MPGMVTGIGGKVEAEESPDQASYRELEEEAGINGIPLTQFCLCEVDNNRQLHFYAGVYPNEDLPQSDDGDIIRVKHDEWQSLPLIATAREVLKEWARRGFGIDAPFTLNLTTEIEWMQFAVNVQEGIHHNPSRIHVLNMISNLYRDDEHSEDNLATFVAYWRANKITLISAVATWSISDQIRFIDGLAFTRDNTVIPFLTEVLKNSDESIRGHSAEALASIGKIHPDDRLPIASILIPCLDDPDHWVRVAVAEALADLAQLEQMVADKAVPALLEVLNQVEKKAVFSLIERAILRIGTNLILPLQYLLDDPVYGGQALWLLEQLDSPKAPIVIQEWRRSTRE